MVLCDFCHDDLVDEEVLVVVDGDEVVDEVDLAVDEEVLAVEAQVIRIGF